MLCLCILFLKCKSNCFQSIENWHCLRVRSVTTNVKLFDDETCYPSFPFDVSDSTCILMVFMSIMCQYWSLLGYGLFGCSCVLDQPAIVFSSKVQLSYSMLKQVEFSILMTIWLRILVFWHMLCHRGAWDRMNVHIDSCNQMSFHTESDVIRTTYCMLICHQFNSITTFSNANLTSVSLETQLKLNISCLYVKHGCEKRYLNLNSTSFKCDFPASSSVFDNKTNDLSLRICIAPYDISIPFCSIFDYSTVTKLNINSNYNNKNVDDIFKKKKRNNRRKH